MSQHHHDPVEENIETHPVKLAIAVTVGAVALIIGIMLLANFAVGSHRIGETDAKANTPEAIARNIAPVVKLAVDPPKGSVPPLAQAAALTPAATPKSAGAASVVAITLPAVAPAVAAVTPSGGEGVYKSACVACHAAGVAGAPKLGDKAAWGARIAKGKATLYEHSLKGFNAMPAKGGNTTLSDADVKAAVDFLVAQAK